MKIRTSQKLNDEIKRLSRLIRKNENDKRNEVRQKKVQVLKSIKKLNNKLKSKQIKPKQYTIQYKDLSKKLKYLKTKRIKITKQDIDSSRANKYSEIFNWKNTFSRGIIGAMARGGLLDDILGFEVASYINSSENYQAIIEKLKTEYAEEFYNLLDRYFAGNLSFGDISSIVKQQKYATALEELWYEKDDESPFFDVSRFETRLSEFMDSIRSDNEKI